MGALDYRQVCNQYGYGKIGGPDATFYYMGKNVSVRDVEKGINLLPFGRYVTLPEEGWFVTFYGDAIKVVEGDIWI